MEKLDILAFAAHPDDIELGCSGTLMKHVSAGDKVGIIDLTQGELGSRGNIKTRYKEAKDASDIMNVSIRENLRFADGFFEHNKKNILQIISTIRKYQPTIVLANTPKDRHPDHGRASKLVEEACFYSGLSKIETTFNNLPQKPWRPQNVFFYIQDQSLEPDFVIDITKQYDKKMAAILAYKTQFYQKDSAEPMTPISSKSFLNFLTGRMQHFGRAIHVEYAEGFIKSRALGIDLLSDFT